MATPPFVGATISRIKRTMATLVRSRLLLAALLGATATLSSAARAQVSTFHLDRLEMPGAPEDGLVLYRPVTQEQALVFGQFAVGYSLNPLRTSNISPLNRNVRTRSDYAVIDHQLSVYATAGIQLLDRLTLSATMEVTPFQIGQNPNYVLGGGLLPSGTTTVSTDGPTASDLRLDARAVVWRTKDRRGAIGLQASVFLPTGSTGAFGGNGSPSALPMVTGEYAPMKNLILVGNMGVHFRPRTAINQPTTGDGLGVGTEWRWAIGAFVPLKGGKYRIGGSIMGQTGLMFDDAIVGTTAFNYQTTPIEWNGEFRMKFGPHGRWWTGAGAGTRIVGGYGAPDLRVLATIGTSFPIKDSRPELAPREAFKKGILGEGQRDTDGDGVPDSVDPCPLEKEDGKEPDPTDGCPAPPDRDGDGILDINDKCPDEPEDKDGIDDEDGCPEKDVDGDGIEDEKDACPRVPGKPNSDPKKNGCPTLIVLEKSQVRVLQQVKFATGSATILPGSFAMLQEVVDLLKVTPSIKTIAVEGHTDNVAGAAFNLDLSRKRAASVRKWLTDHGVESSRLTSEGFGLTKPIGDNKTDVGRAANRRVEFKIVGAPPSDDNEAPKSTDEKDDTKTPTPHK